MSEPFLITGLPRSKTAWMSVVCTAAGSFCRHEPIGQITELDDLRPLWTDPTLRYVGISDSAMGFFLDWVMREVKPRTLIIDRDILEVEASLRKLEGIETNYCGLLLDSIDEWRGNSLVMSVDFEALSDLKTLKRCLNHLMPTQAFNDEHLKEMLHMNVQTDFGRSCRIAVERATELRRLFHPIQHLLRLKAA